MKLAIKRTLESMPYYIGKYAALVPFKYRFGRQYTSFSKLINSESTNEQIINYSISHLKCIFEYAKKNIPFYTELYKAHNVFDLEINELSDFKKLPIITKDTIRNSNFPFNGRFNLNTGGSSGSPFSFYVDKNAFAREWAHMHKIWKYRDYNYRDLKITLRGKNIKKNIIYNSIHNEFIINSYVNPKMYKKELLDLFINYKISYIHGYPSSIYNFLKCIANSFTIDEIEIIKKNIRSCLLGSEYPLPYITDFLKNYWGFDYISWYGHSEMCVLAYDSENLGEYKPFYTYGFTEYENNQLIGTSFHNYDMPLIRYNTEDLIIGKSQNDIVKSFRISQGRIGDFILDSKENKIPLTALIFGRHHKIFQFINTIQVSQVKAGYATFLLTCDSSSVKSLNMLTLFDLSNVNIQFEIKIIDKPILTKAGKMQLKVIEE